MVLPATPRGSPAAREGQVNVPLTQNNDLPYGFWAPADSVTDPPATARGVGGGFSRPRPRASAEHLLTPFLVLIPPHPRIRLHRVGW